LLSCLTSLPKTVTDIHDCKQEGSSFKATYVVDWDRENYFSEINIRQRKFEKERLEQQERRLLVEAARRQYSEAQQAKFAHLEQERLEIEQRAKILRWSALLVSGQPQTLLHEIV